MTSTVLIIDDEPIQREILKKYCLTSSCFKRIFEAKDLLIAQELIKKEKIDLLLMDIQMPHVNGIDWLSKNTISIPVILITAYSNFAVKSYELNVVDYLLKPVSYDRFLQSLNKVFSKTSTTQEYNNTIWIKRGAKQIRLQSNSIIYVEAKGNYSILYLTDTKPIIVYSTLKKLHEIKNDNNFIQIHRSFIVNKTKITEIDKNNIYIQDIKIPIGNLYRPNLTPYLDTI